MTLKYSVAIALVLLPMLAHGDKTAKPAGATATVPFEMLRTRHLAVQIKVNGKGPYRVIFDTGAPINLLSGKVAKEAGLVKKAPGRGMPMLFGMQGQVIAETLEVGSLKAEKVAVIVMDHPTIKAVAKVLGPLEGIIGFPFFSQYRTTLDYQAQAMMFEPVDYRAASVMDRLMVMMMANNQKPVEKHISPTTVWGFRVVKEKGDEAAGVNVDEVLAGSAAAAGGVQAGDRLLVFDGTWTDSVNDCHRAASGVKPGETVKAKLKRGDTEIIVDITARAGL